MLFWSLWIFSPIVGLVYLHVVLFQTSTACNRISRRGLLRFWTTTRTHEIRAKFRFLHVVVVQKGVGGV